LTHRIEAASARSSAGPLRDRRDFAALRRPPSTVSDLRGADYKLSYPCVRAALAAVARRACADAQYPRHHRLTSPFA
jgi:hypothetical protein